MLYQGDAMTVPLKDASVRLIVTSPPYFALRSYTYDEREVGLEGTHVEYLDALIAATSEMMRVLTDDGNLFVNVGDRTAGAMANRNWEKINTRDDDYRKHESHRAGKANMRRDTSHSMPGIPARSLAGLPWRYAIRCVDELDLLLRAEIIWSKPNPVPDYSTTKRVARSHEQFFHFTKQADSYSGAERPAGFLSVWTQAATPSPVQHTAAFPSLVVRRIISHWSEPGNVVFDPFAGSGTTERMALTLGRVGVGGDLDLETITEAKAYGHGLQLGLR